MSPTRWPLIDASYKPSAVAYSRARATSLSIRRSLRNIGGVLGTKIGFAGPRVADVVVAGGRSFDCADGESIHFADQSLGCSSPISHTPGSLVISLPSRSQTMTFQ